MPKLTLLSLFAALMCVPLHAQSPDYRFGKVSEEELRMTSYDKDPEAEAVYLNEENSFYYQIGNDILITRDYRARIKILKPEGTGKADVSLSYIDNYNWRENVSGIDAAAYNLVDGKIVKTPLKKQYVFTEQLDENRKLIKFSIPEVREGTVIEYKYRISSKNITYIPSFRFQHDIPVMRSRMTAAIPEFFRFNLSMKGYVRINVNEDASTGTIGSGPNSLSYSIRNIATEAADIPALKREEYVWSLNDFRSTLDFELSQIAFPNSPVKNYATTWEDVNEALRKSTFDTHCRIGNPYKDEVAAIKAAEGTPEEKIRQVLRLVQSKMKWNEEYRLFSKGPRAAANKGTGSSADINFVLMAVLKDAGFEAVPVLLSPRHMGRLPYAHPTIDGINAFVVRVALGDGKHAYLDGTNPNSSLNLLPTALLVDRARVYGVNDESGWCDLTNLVKNASTINLILKLNEDNTLTGTFIQQDANQAALRVSTAYTNAKSQEEYIESLEKSTASGSRISTSRASAPTWSYRNTEPRYSPRRPTNSSTSMRRSCRSCPRTSSTPNPVHCPSSSPCRSPTASAARWSCLRATPSRNCPRTSTYPPTRTARAAGIYATRPAATCSSTSSSDSSGFSTCRPNSKTSIRSTAWSPTSATASS